MERLWTNEDTGRLWTQEGPEDTGRLWTNEDTGRLWTNEDTGRHWTWSFSSCLCGDGT